MKNKRVEIIENPDAGIRCHCRLLDLYNSKLPEEAEEKVLFYICPKERVNKTSTCEHSSLYYSIPIGCNELWGAIRVKTA